MTELVPPLPQLLLLLLLLLNFPQVDLDLERDGEKQNLAVVLASGM